MENDFNTLTGCWPESYFFADKDGVCKWHPTASRAMSDYSMTLAHEAAANFGIVQKVEAPAPEETFYDNLINADAEYKSGYGVYNEASVKAQPVKDTATNVKAATDLADIIDRLEENCGMKIKDIQ